MSWSDVLAITSTIVIIAANVITVGYVAVRLEHRLTKLETLVEINTHKIGNLQ